MDLHQSEARPAYDNQLVRTADHVWLRCAEGGRSTASTMVLADNAVMVFECGPWAGCPLGADCPQAVTQQVRVMPAPLSLLPSRQHTHDCFKGNVAWHLQ